MCQVQRHVHDYGARRDSAGGCCDWSPTGDGASDAPWWLWDPSTWPPQVAFDALQEREREQGALADGLALPARPVVRQPSQQGAEGRAEGALLGVQEGGPAIV